MKENKIIFYISIIVCILTISISIYLHFFQYSKVHEFVSNILLNIFASSSVLICTSLVNYFIDRRRILDMLMNKCINLEKLFSKVSYLQEFDYGSFEQYKQYNKNITKEIYEVSKQNYENKQYEQMEIIMKQYLSIIEYDLSDFYDIYNKIDFISGKKIKFEIHNKIFNYTMELRNIIAYYTSHFSIYFDAENGNKKVNYNFVRKLQENIFDIKNNNTDDTFNGKYIDFVKNTYISTKNKICEYYISMINFLGKIAYYDKNYKFIQEKMDS